MGWKPRGCWDGTCTCRGQGLTRAELGATLLTRKSLSSRAEPTLGWGMAQGRTHQRGGRGVMEKAQGAADPVGHQEGGDLGADC